MSPAEFLEFLHGAQAELIRATQPWAAPAAPTPHRRPAKPLPEDAAQAGATLGHGDPRADGSRTVSAALGAPAPRRGVSAGGTCVPPALSIGGVGVGAACSSLAHSWVSQACRQDWGHRGLCARGV